LGHIYIKIKRLTWSDPKEIACHIEKQWFTFKAARDKEDIRDWLESIGIKLEE